jgi:hypothetical protein
MYPSQKLFSWIVISFKKKNINNFLFEDLHNLLNHLWMPDTYFVNAKETQVSKLTEHYFYKL